MNDPIDNAKHPCPCCGNPLKVHRYKAEIWGTAQTVEVSLSCTCGYGYATSYGQIVENFPDKKEPPHGGK